MKDLIKSPNIDVIINTYNLELNTLKYEKYKQAVKLLQTEDVISTYNPIYTILSHSCIKTLSNPNDVNLRMDLVEKIVQELNKLHISNTIELYMHIEGILDDILNLILHYDFKLPSSDFTLELTDSKSDTNQNHIVPIILLHITKGFSTNPVILLQKQILTNKEYYIWLASYVGLIPPKEFSTHHWVALET